jgi:hypothetical protein
MKGWVYLHDAGDSLIRVRIESIEYYVSFQKTGNGTFVHLRGGEILSVKENDNVVAKLIEENEFRS